MWPSWLELASFGFPPLGLASLKALRFLPTNGGAAPLGKTTHPAFGGSLSSPRAACRAAGAEPLDTLGCPLSGWEAPLWNWGWS